ncbi:hypothetical protein ACFXPI_11165 [Streptomyces sp. NPDC059104]|uniref:hypothetical protein n=1 Tax=Streptomyces sp. NPDC059104 TaxID=3346729 RepID=UPI0036C9C1AE
MTPRRHSWAGYQRGCRCHICSYSARRYQDAEPVRVHIRTLQAQGIGIAQIARLAGVEHGRVREILNGIPSRGQGPRKRIRPALAEAVLRVQPSVDDLAAATLIDATGTRRRLQGLVAWGWPQVWLANRLGTTETHLGKMLRAERVTARMARAVRGLYSDLSGQDPRAHGVDRQAYSRARRAAVAESWPPPAAWDEETMDDPDTRCDAAARAAIRRGVAA